eukprot:230114-Chlamydomonas_euryale.AAC.5
MGVKPVLRGSMSHQRAEPLKDTGNVFDVWCVAMSTGHRQASIAAVPCSLSAWPARLCLDTL